MAYDSRNGSRNYKNVQDDDIVDSCRVCMANNKNMNSVFEKIKENIISDKISFCTGLQVTNNDGLPTQICNKCLEDLIVAFKFKTSCLLADETFRSLIKKNIKSEIVDTTYDDFNYVDDGYDDDDFGDGPKVKDELLMNVLAENGVAVRSDGDIKLENLERLVKRRSHRRYPSNRYLGEVKPRRRSLADSAMDILPFLSPTKVKVPRKKRGPYKKSGKPKRLKKYTFPRLTCLPCKTKFKSKQEFDEHKKNNHKDEEDRWVCEICGKVFIHRASHYTHIKSHQPPSYLCSHCDYKTWHKHDLVKHIRIHTGVKLYQCEFCSQSYYTSSNLTGHIRRFHEGTKPFACTMCDKRFHDRTKLNRHVDSHNDVKRFECDICHSCYTRRCYWKKHLLTQHNVVVPPQRPGRQKTNLIIGNCLINNNTTLDQ